jgi:hypothetical protein
MMLVFSGSVAKGILREHWIPLSTSELVQTNSLGALRFQFFRRADMEGN